METNHYQPPKTAIIRLLKSQGCCATQNANNPNPHIQQMLKYRQELNIKAVQQRARLSQIPCAITLAQEISELKEVVNGLGRQNRSRIDYLSKIKQRTSSHTIQEGSDREQQYEHQRLQQEYANLLRTLEATNETNRRLVERLSRW